MVSTLRYACEGPDNRAPCRPIPRLAAAPDETYLFSLQTSADTTESHLDSVNVTLLSGSTDDIPVRVPASDRQPPPLGRDAVRRQHGECQMSVLRNAPLVPDRHTHPVFVYRTPWIGSPNSAVPLLKSTTTTPRDPHALTAQGSSWLCRGSWNIPVRRHA